MYKKAVHQLLAPISRRNLLQQLNDLFKPTTRILIKYDIVAIDLDKIE